MKAFSRNKRDTNDVERGNSFDYRYWLLHATDEGCDEYYRNKKRTLIKLIKAVMENELTDKQREVVTLVKIQGLKGKDAAHILNINPSTVSRHLEAA